MASVRYWLRRRLQLLVGAAVFLLLATLYIVGGYFIVMQILHDGFEGHMLGGLVTRVFTFCFIFPSGVVVATIFAYYITAFIYRPAINHSVLNPVLQ